MTQATGFAQRLHDLAREIEGCAKYAALMSKLGDDPGWFEAHQVPEFRARAEADRDHLSQHPYMVLDVLVQTRRLCWALAAIADMSETQAWKGLRTLKAGLEEILAASNSRELLQQEHVQR